ncbi:toll/interleukin-1 receptor domain-containing protein [Corynebacterium gallinarum]|uniref:Toll/interleukin-1 receptor domain-containing protein n=1 Tax=Corynebacterium gallinarum TaxID=2762214 RepID=A0A8I0HGF1_9CORY|nr:toll/interleukin-1 receptor domain-containing protein [Corynebacterium gallinarum]MBD8031346.1 toll/interleukin-1 receptor domain-containing protein [Corynebacterium gallinarum]
MKKPFPPKVFVSYAHVSEDHKTWVRGLASRLRADGVDVQLDQWHNTLGSNLPFFMESGLRGADRVLAIISDDYRERIDNRQGGAGFEGQLLSSDLLTNQTETRVIPVLRDNTVQDFNTAVPTLLRGYMGIDMRDSDLFEGRYEELLRDIHGRPMHQAPPIGDNPFDGAADYMPLPVSQLPSAYSNFEPGPDPRLVDTLKPA